MHYMLTCPSCGAEPEKANLHVVAGIFKTAGLPLTSDGFDLSRANVLITEKVIVQCQACEEDFLLENLELPEEPPTVSRDLYVMARVACDLCGDKYPLNVIRVGMQGLTGEKKVLCPDCFAFEALEATTEAKEAAHRRLTERELENHLAEAKK